MLLLTSQLETVSLCTRRDSFSSACNSACAPSMRLGQRLDLCVDESSNFLCISYANIR